MQAGIITEKGNIERDTFIAVILSFFFMGLGQAYSGQRRRGYIFFASYIGIAVLYLILSAIFNEPLPKRGEEAMLTSRAYIITLLSSIVIWLFNIFDAYWLAKRVNEGDIITDTVPGKSAFVFLRNVVLACVISFIGFLLLIYFTAIIFKK